MRVVRSGDWEAEISGDLEQQINAALGSAGRAVVRAVDAEVQLIYNNAVAAWPRKTGTSARLLSRKTVIDTSGAVVGEVRAGASYSRFIQSWQIANRPGGDSPGTVEHLRALGVPDPSRQRLIAQRAASAVGKQNGRAAKSGSAMWLLLRWPEQIAGWHLTDELQPIIERALAGQLES